MVVHKDRPPLTILILVLEISLRRPTLAKSLKSQSNQNGGAKGLISTHHISLGYEDLPRCEVDFSFKSLDLVCLCAKVAVDIHTQHTQVKYNALFVSAITFSGKQFIFQKAFFGKLSHFPVFGNNLKNELENVFWCLVSTSFKTFLV